MATTIWFEVSATGELIKAALDAGAQRIILAIGGSATNDAGAGALQALGLGLFDAQGQPLPRGGLALATLARIDLQGLDVVKIIEGRE